MRGGCPGAGALASPSAQCRPGVPGRPGRGVVSIQIIATVCTPGRLPGALWPAAGGRQCASPRRGSIFSTACEPPLITT